jgi:hypothetical protein
MQTGPVSGEGSLPGFQITVFSLFSSGRKESREREEAVSCLFSLRAVTSS